mgnify:CR=1 FL=1
MSVIQPSVTLEYYTAVHIFPAYTKYVYRLLFCDVIGWWYVACNGIEGWAPATYLEKINLSDDQVSDSSEKDEIPCMAGGYTITDSCFCVSLH